MNVHIRPSLADYHKTEGLCGLLDNNAGNDLQKRPGSDASSIPRSWM